MSVSNNKQRKIVFSATNFADANSSLSMAINLAKTVDGRIEAYLVEEEAIRRFAAYPSARTILKGGSNSVRVTVERMRKAFQRDASIFREALSIAASNATIDWSLKKREGSIDSILYEKTAKGADFILFGWQKIASQTGSGVLVIQDAEEEDNQLLDIASHIAKPIKQEISTIQISDKANFEDHNSPSILTKNDLVNFIKEKSFTVLITSTGIAKHIGLNALVNACRCPVLVSNI